MSEELPKKEEIMAAREKFEAIVAAIKEFDTSWKSFTTKYPANQLPTKYKKLEEFVSKAEGFKTRAEAAEKEMAKTGQEIAGIKVSCEGQQTKMDEFLESFKETEKNLISRVDGVVEKSNQALASATSVGLSAVFTEQASAQNKNMWGWLALLAASIIVTALLAVWRVNVTEELIAKSAQVGVVVLYANYLISAISIGIPLWVAWLAIRQIGYTFRLKEDYAFKAVASASYMGFRKEMEDQKQKDELTESLLARYNEHPLRFVDYRDSTHPFIDMLKAVCGRKNVDSSSSQKITKS